METLIITNRSSLDNQLGLADIQDNHSMKNFLNSHQYNNNIKDEECIFKLEDTNTCRIKNNKDIQIKQSNIRNDEESGNNLKEKDENITEKIKVSSNKKYDTSIDLDIARKNQSLHALDQSRDNNTSLNNIAGENSQGVNFQQIEQNEENQENLDPKVDNDVKSAKCKPSPRQYKLSLKQPANIPKPCDQPEKLNPIGDFISPQAILNQNDSSSLKNNTPNTAIINMKNSLITRKSQKIIPASPMPKFEDIITVNRTSIYFGANLPGKISEENLDIMNKSNENLVLQIIIECHNSELQDTDEYVYSIRRTHLYDYNDKHLLLMSPYSSAAFKLALKVPNMRLKAPIKGCAIISIQNTNLSVKLPLESTVVIPRIFCPKELYLVSHKCNVIKLAMKMSKRVDSKIPLKNNSPLPVTLEFEFYKPKHQTPEQLASEPIECLICPSIVPIPANGMSLVGIIMKPKAQNTGNEDDKKIRLVQKILTGKCRDSTLIFTFILLIECHQIQIKMF